MIAAPDRVGTSAARQRVWIARGWMTSDGTLTPAGVEHAKHADTRRRGWWDHADTDSPSAEQAS